MKPQTYDELAAERDALLADAARLKGMVQAHKTWEDEACAQASNANLAYNQIRVTNQTLRAELSRAEAALRELRKQLEWHVGAEQDRAYVVSCNLMATLNEMTAR